VLGTWHKDVALTLFKLGEVQKLSGELDEALGCFECALEIDRLLFSGDPMILAKTLNEIGHIYLVKGDIPKMMASSIEAARLYLRAGHPLSSLMMIPILRIYGTMFDVVAAAA
jgi:tetratricopeptide (TPR) repeat protein